MASRKKGKKSKWQPVPLTDLLPETPGGMPSMPVKVASSWADDVDDDHGGYTDSYSSRKAQEPVVLPTAPRAARGPGIDEENIPTNPPFVAYIYNLPYDVLEEDLAEFFQDMQVTNMRLPKDSNKLKGYGYVDFEDRQSLIDALAMSNSSIKGRRVRIEVSNSNSDDRRGRMGMGRDYGRRDNYDDADRNSTDWRSGPRDEPSSGDGDRFRSRGSGFDRGDRRDDRESSASDNRPGAWREGRAALPDLPDRGGSGFSERRGYRSDDKDREYSRFGDRDRDGPGGGGGGGGGGERGGDRGGGSFGPRRNYGDRDRERERDRESDWGNRLSSRPAATADDPPSSEPRTRVKLNLQPRTKPIEAPVVRDESNAEKSESDDAAPAAPVAAPTPVPAANIFGAAKPVDTTAREREIEERLARTYADSKPKGEEGEKKGPPKEGAWGRRNGEGRSDNEKEKPRATWRSEEDGGRHIDRPSNRNPGSGRAADQRTDSRGPPSSRHAGQGSRGPQRSSDSRGPPERERKDRDREDGIPPMPRATDEQAPNFVASNKYSMLPEDADSDNSNN